jgi:transposase
MNARDQLIVRNYRAGMNLKQIADVVGLHYVTVGEILTKLGERTPKKRGQHGGARDGAGRKPADSDNSGTSAEHDDTIRHLKSLGLSLTKSAEMINRSRGFVWYRATSMGIHQTIHKDLAKLEPVNAGNRDDAYVAACLAEGGFVYREVRGGRVVEVRP